MGSAEGLSPFAGSLRVSLRYNFFPSLTGTGAIWIVERVFQPPASHQIQTSQTSAIDGGTRI